MQMERHRRKTFVLGIIVAALSTQDLAMTLLTQNVDPYSYFLPYTFSQDHLELLFSCVRSKNGFNNNPDVRTFKSAMKGILLRVSIIASKHTSCLAFEQETTRPMLSLKWRINRTPLYPEEDG